jgi:hypothetical protein
VPSFGSPFTGPVIFTKTSADFARPLTEVWRKDETSPRTALCHQPRSTSERSAITAKASRGATVFSWKARQFCAFLSQPDGDSELAVIANSAGNGFVKSDFVVAILSNFSVHCLHMMSGLAMCTVIVARPAAGSPPNRVKKSAWQKLFSVARRKNDSLPAAMKARRKHSQSSRWSLVTPAVRALMLSERMTSNFP